MRPPVPWALSWCQEVECAYHRLVAFDERAFFTERSETRQGQYQCPKCRRTNNYDVRWVRRSKKDRLPSGAGEEDRARFAKLRDYLLRIDEDVVCKTCGRKFEIPSQQSLVFVDQLAGLPNDDELQKEIDAASAESAPARARPSESKPAIPARFTRKTTGWK